MHETSTIVYSSSQKRYTIQIVSYIFQWLFAWLQSERVDKLMLKTRSTIINAIAKNCWEWYSYDGYSQSVERLMVYKYFSLIVSYFSDDVKSCH